MLSSNQGEKLPAHGSAATRWPLLRLAATVAACCTLSAENGAQQVQSDWALSEPLPIASGPAPRDLRQHMILDNIFFSQVPVLKQRPSPVSPIGKQGGTQGVGGFSDADGAFVGNIQSASETPPTEMKSASEMPLTNPLRTAVRPDGIDGWRPAGQDQSPAGSGQHVPLSEFFSSEPVTEAVATARPATPSPMSHDGVTPPPPPTPPAEADAADGGSDAVSSDNSRQSASADALASETDDEESEASAAAPAAAAPAIAPTPEKPLPPLTRQLTYVRSRVRGVLRGYYRKQLNSREHNPWEVMHGMLAYELQSRIRQGSPRGKLITSIGWLCYNKPCKGQTLMHVTREGELRARYGVGLQGHLGQLLAMLAQCRVSPDYPILVGQHQFTIRDLIEAEKKTCYPDSELTFKLLAFQQYVDLDEKWVNDQGLEWDFPLLIREELAQPIRGAACGGTHRLSSLSLTVKARVRRGEPLDGEYARAAEFVNKYHQYAFQLQNRDGSLSTSWFRGRGDESDIDRRIKTTGHILEWLCYSLSDEELRDQRTLRAVSYLANLMASNYDNDWEVGPMCHAIHALMVYDERVFQPYDRPGYAVSYRPRPSSSRR